MNQPADQPQIKEKMKMMFKVAIYLMAIISAGLLVMGWLVAVLPTIGLNSIVAALSTSVFGLAALILCFRIGMFASSRVR